jgi:hypothetical protein
VPPPPVTLKFATEFLAEGHAAFRGKVLSFRGVPDTMAFEVLTKRPVVTPGLEYTVSIAKWWGGTGFDTVHVHSAADPAACGVELGVGEEYLFLSYNNKGNRVGVAACLAPRRPSDASDLIRLLDSAEVRQKARRQ